MKKIYSILLAGLLLVLLPIIGQATTITIDNDFSEWDDEGIVDLFDGDANVLGTDYWWDTDLSQWATTEPAYDTWKANQEQMLDIIDFRMTNDEDNICMMMESVYPFMGVLQESTGNIYPYGYPTVFDEHGQPTEFVPDAPADFDHSIVLSFDTDQNDTLDYFAAMNFNWLADTSGENAMTITRTIYQDDGDGAYTPDADTVIFAITNPEETVSANIALDAGEGMGKQIEACSALTGDEGLTFLQLGETVNVRLETHSDPVDYSDIMEYTLEDEVVSNALVVGTGKIGSKMGKGEVYLYDAATGDEISSFTAYDKKVGARVAVGDVDGDGEQEIITVPWKQYRNPELKIFNTSGESKTADHLLKKRLKLSHKYDLAIGDVNNDDVDEIILARANGHKLIIYVLSLKDNGQLKILDKYTEDKSGYVKDVWLEVGNVDTADDAEEIVTAPLKGPASFDLWKYTDDEITYTANLTEGATSYNKGMHLAAGEGEVYAFTYLSGGSVNNYTYDADTYFTAGDVSFGHIGKIGDIILAGDNIVASSWKKKEVTIYDTSGEEVLTIDVNSKAAFLDYIN